MRLKACPDWGVVVDLEEMKDLGKIDNEEDFRKEKEKPNTFISDECQEGFYCPCCKKWVGNYFR